MTSESTTIQAVRTTDSSKALSFRLWQMRAFFSMALLYLFYYFGKKNIGSATKAIEDAFSLSHQQFGLISTAFTLTYALGQFVNGFLGDRYNPKLIMLVGAIGGVIANLLFGFSGALAFFVIFWAMNGYFSSMGWAPGCRMLCNWFPERRWGWWMGLYNFFPYFGGALVAPVAAWAVAHFGWKAAFILCPAFLLGMAVLFVFLGKSSPEAAGFQAPWRMRKEENAPEHVGLREYWRAFTNRKMIVPYAVAFGANGIRWGLLNWNIMILQTPVEEGGFGLALVQAAFIASLVDWGGMFFAIALGVVSDRLFRGRRWHTIVLSMIVAAGALLVMAQGAPILSRPMGMLLLCAAMFVAGGLIQGIHTPLFCLPGDILGQRLSGTGAGIMDGWMYVGAALAGFPLGWWFDQYGLTAGLALLAVLSLVFGLVAIGVRR